MNDNTMIEDSSDRYNAINSEDSIKISTPTPTPTPQRKSTIDIKIDKLTLIPNDYNYQTINNTYRKIPLPSPSYNDTNQRILPDTRYISRASISRPKNPFENLDGILQTQTQPQTQSLIYNNNTSPENQSPDHNTTSLQTQTPMYNSNNTPTTEIYSQTNNTKSIKNPFELYVKSINNDENYDVNKYENILNQTCAPSMNMSFVLDKDTKINPSIPSSTLKNNAQSMSANSLMTLEMYQSNTLSNFDDEFSIDDKDIFGLDTCAIDAKINNTNSSSNDITYRDINTDVLQPKTPYTTTEDDKDNTTTNDDTSIYNQKDIVLSFSNSMFNHFDRVVEQIQSGIYTTKRIAAFAQKIANVEEEKFKGIQKALVYESGKQDHLQRDGMATFIDAYSNTKKCIAELNLISYNTIVKLHKQVINPLTELTYKTESKLRDITNDEHKCSKEMAVARAQVTKYQKESNKQYTQLMAQREEREKNAVAQQNQTDAEKKSFFAYMRKHIKAAAQGDPKKMTEQLITSSRLYSEAVKNANERQRIYIEKDAPRMFNSLQELEKTRLTVTKQKQYEFHSIFNDRSKPTMNIYSNMLDITKNLEPSEQQQIYLKDWLGNNGEPTALEPFVYQLPFTSEDIANGKLDKPNSVFRSTLEQCMKLQEDKYPDLNVPLVVDILIAEIEKNNGYETEGIFRISYHRNQQQKLRQQFERGNYEITDTSPHAPAALLKVWLHDLPDSLIPTDSYLEAINIVKLHSSESIEIQERLCLDQQLNLPPVNRNIIIRIAIMCDKISSPDNNKKSRMSIDGLSIVFAPSLLRNPSEDPHDQMSNTKYEARFTSILFLSIVKHMQELSKIKYSIPYTVDSSKTVAPSELRAVTLPQVYQ